MRRGGVLEILLAAGGAALDRVEQRCWKWLATSQGRTKGVCKQREYANKGSMGLEIARTALCVCGFLVFQYTLTTFYFVLTQTSTEQQLVSSLTVFISVSTYRQS